MPAEPEIGPITILTPIRRWWTVWLRITWPFADRTRLIKGPLHNLKFIHIAHWGIVPRGRWFETPYILFQSNYDGPAAEYIEAFAYTVPSLIRGLWHGAYDFPGPVPENEFVAYVLRIANDGERHYYAAYPDESLRTIRSALDLEPRFEALKERVRRDPERLPAEWRAFVTKHARDL